MKLLFSKNKDDSIYFIKNYDVFTIKCYIFIGVRRLKLTWKDRNKFKLFLEDGCELFDDEEIMDESLVMGKTLILAFTADDIYDADCIPKAVVDKYASTEFNLNKHKKIDWSWGSLKKKIVIHL